MRYGLIISCLTAFVLSSSVAFGQPVPSSTPPALPDARGITAFCGSLPPLDAPVRPGAALTTPTDPLITAGEALSERRYPEAIASFWQAFTIVAPDTHAASRRMVGEIGNPLLTALAAQGPSTQDQRCALLGCLVSRIAPGAVRSRFVREFGDQGCSVPQANPIVTPPALSLAGTFVLTREERLALAFDLALQQRIRQENAMITPDNGDWRLPLRFREPINEALRLYRLEQHARTTPPTPTRSLAGRVVPISLWATGAIALGTGIVFGAMCASANAELDAANRGETDGWPRQTAVDAQNSCLRATVLIPTGAALLGGGTLSWFLMRARPSVAVTRQHVGLTLTGSF